MSVKKGLGRGFDSLVPAELFDESFDPTASQDERVSELRNIKLSEIKIDPDQPRRRFDEAALNELAESVKEHGILQPIVVTPHAGGYMIVAGERRYRAAVMANLTKIPAIVRTLSNQHKLEISLIENLQRSDLNALETATAYVKLRDQFNLTLDEIGRRVGGKSGAAISNTLRLLRLPEAVRQAVADGQLSEGQARPLVNMDPAIVEKILPQILREDWSARKVEQFAVQMKISKNLPPKNFNQDPTIPYAEDTNQLKSRLKAEVKVKTNSRGAGQIVIKFKNDQDFKRLQKLLG